MACASGLRAWMVARFRGQRETFSMGKQFEAPYYSVGVSIYGNVGEAMVAKALGVFWMGNAGETNQTDLCGLEVRMSFRADANLIIKARDHEDTRVVLVRGLVFGTHGVSADIPGWITPREARGHPEWFFQHPERKDARCQLAPADCLHPMSELQGS